MIANYTKNNVKKTVFQLKLGDRLSALRDPQREGNKGLVPDQTGFYFCIQNVNGSKSVVRPQRLNMKIH